MESQAELVSELKGWCCGEVLDEAHALMVLIREDVEVTQIEETLHTVKCLGRVCVRGRNYNMRRNRYMILCECREELKRENVPAEVMPTDGNEAWPIVIVGEALSAPVDSFSELLAGAQQAEERTGEKPQSRSPTPVSPSSQTESILRALGELLDKTKPTIDHGSYRRLRIFSGTLPIPAGEEQFEHWIEQAWLMVEECDCSVKEKRRRLMESLKGPALEIVKAARASNPDVSPEQCLEAVEHVFGTAESGDDLYFAFRSMQQQSGEKLSDFLRRLEGSLDKVIKKGGVLLDRVDKVRLEQLLRGAVASVNLSVNLRLRERRDKPPTFLQLLKELRTEEEYEASRKRLNPAVQSVHIKPEIDVKQAEIQGLRAELKELKALVAAVVTRPDQAMFEHVETTPFNASLHSEPGSDSELKALRKQMKRLQTKFTHKVTNKETAAAVSTVEASNYDSRSPHGPPRVAEENFCYRCGESGHYAGKCYQVIKRLIQALRVSKDKQQTRDVTADVVDCGVKKSAVSVQSTTIPDGLVGPPSLVKLKVSGQPCTALLDSGSQVTIIFEPWYQKYLSDIPIQPVSGLALWGLSESSVSYPYRGYIVVDLEYPAEILGTTQTVTVLALICPSPKTADQTSVIVGTNASHVRRLVKQCRDSGIDVTQTLGIKAYETGEHAPPEVLEEGGDDVGHVRWQGPGPLTIPSGGEVHAVCKIELTHAVDQEILIIKGTKETRRLMTKELEYSPWRSATECCSRKHKLESRWSPDPYVVVGKMPNLPVFTIKRENGGTGTKTIHRDNLLPIGQFVRIPNTDSVIDVPVGPKTRPVTRQKSKITSLEMQKVQRELQEVSDSSSDPEFYAPCNTYPREFLHRALYDDRHTVAAQEGNHQADGSGADAISSSDDDAEPEHHSLRDQESDRELAPGDTSDADSESGHEQETFNVSKDNGRLRTEPRPKRAVKPTVRLTYDELGRSRDQPLIIVHRGIVIKIGHT
ncbi:Paraneoplastic antigen Ma3 [Merluccius polli]|uniref:Paraneoplastic antigen Ma3 n=1 Tax=Merluccius polli TaxID=89951 RepID=A0AA47NS68_MERPO|nr:Paraneoplastic antigen Ma3 [Merluccius polli]